MKGLVEFLIDFLLWGACIGSPFVLNSVALHAFTGREAAHEKS
jgi:hypothetical protein